MPTFVHSGAEAFESKELGSNHFVSPHVSNITNFFFFFKEKHYLHKIFKCYVLKAMNTSYIAGEIFLNGAVTLENSKAFPKNVNHSCYMTKKFS